jgi:hypothetical protein
MDKKKGIGEKILDWLFCGPQIIFITCGVIALMIVTIVHVRSLDDENIVLEGDIISAKYLGTADRGYIGCDLIELEFSNGQNYTIVTNRRSDLDLTVNSKIILNLHKDSPDEYWEIVSIYKVPGD